MDNVAGIGQLLAKDVDIYLLQEVIIPKHQLEQRFPNYNTYTSKGEGMLGIATLVKKSIQVNASSNILPGRLQVTKLQDIQIINIYSPAGTNLNQERREFFNTYVLSALKDTSTIIGGDFNSVIDPKDVQRNYKNKRSIEWKDLVNTFKLIDIYRTLYPNGEEYTFHRPGSSSTRLDRIYITTDLKNGIKECTHHQTLSDHKAVKATLTFNPGQSQHKPNRKKNNTWKLNNSILENIEIQEAMQEYVQSQLENIPAEDLPEIWEVQIIPNLRKMLIDYSKLCSEFRRDTKLLLQAMLEEAIENENWEDATYAKQRLRSMIEEELYGYILRSKENELEEKQTGNTNHANKCFKRQSNSNINTLIINGNEVTDTKEIEEEISKYYEAIYKGYHRTKPSSDEVTNTGMEFTPDWNKAEDFIKDLPRLDETTAERITRPILENEVLEAIKEAKTNASPGPDGLTYELYKSTKHWITPILTKLFNIYMRTNELPNRYLKATTRLIPKVQTTPTVEQLRPITLQCCEYKLLSKIMSTRILSTLNKVIGPWQHCSIPGRNITTPLINTISAIEYATNHNIAAYVVSTDIFKAYDRTNIKYITKVMEKMGYKEATTKMIEAMHKNCTTEILTQKGITIELPGLRQGDPLSGPLYTINIEPLNRKLDAITTGISIGPTTQKTGSFMDDINITSTKIDDLKKIDKAFREYEDVNGTLLSRTKKTRIMGLGKWANKSDWPIKWIQTTKEMKLLGIVFSPSIVDTYKNTWTNIIKNIRSTTQKWTKERNWPMTTKAKIINKFILSKLWYAGQILHCQQEIINTIEKTISHYMFHDQIERIKLEELYKPKEEGGLGLVNIGAKCQALLTRTSLKMVKTSPQMRYWVGIPLRKHIDVKGPKSERPTDYFKEIAKLIKEVIEIPGNPTSKSIYKLYTDTDHPSRIELKHENAIEQCRRMYSTRNPNLANTQFKVLSNTLPTKERLNDINPRKWPDKMCNQCRTTANIVHITTKCIKAQELWNWTRDIIKKLDRSATTWSDKELIELNFPDTNKEKEISYVVMKHIENMWNATREHKNTNLEKYKYMIRQDLMNRKSMKLPKLVITL